MNISRYDSSSYTMLLLFIAAVYAQTVPTLVADFKALDPLLASLTTAVNDYSGGAIAARPIQRAASKVTVGVQKLSTDAQTLDVQPDDQAQLILDAVIGLTPNIQRTIDAIGKKAATFPASLKPTIATNLGDLSKSTQSLTDTFAGKSSDTFKPKIQDEGRKLNEIFQAGRKAFN